MDHPAIPESESHAVRGSNELYGESARRRDQAPDDSNPHDAESHLASADTSDDGGLSNIVKTVAAIGLVDAVSVGYFAGRGAGVSAAYGAGLGLANLVFMGRLVRSFLGRSDTSRAWVMAALTKLAVLVLAMYLPVRAGLVHVLPFMIGFGALPLGIALGQLLTVPSKSKES